MNSVLRREHKGQFKEHRVAMSQQGKHIYEFGPFRLDVPKQLLLRESQPVHLKPKVFDLLVVLVQGDGQMLTKEELMQWLWADSFVEENNLAVSISALRKALGESHNEHLYIETIPRRGYRFVADVKKVFSSGATHLEEKGHSRGASSNTRGILTGFETVSIAVLPLEIIGTELNDEYLGLGLADTLITKLSNLRLIHVRPTSAVRKYVGGKREPVRIGHELGVEFVLEGNIRRVGERARITMQLVMVHDEVILWAEKFDECLKDIFVIEDSISQQVANALRLTLTGTEKELLVKRHTVSTEAYQAYMKGRYFCNKRTSGALKKSIYYFEQAIKIDRDYAQPYVGLADAYIHMGHAYALPPKAAYVKAEQCVLQSLQRDRELVEARTTLAHLKMLNSWDWRGAEEEFSRVIQINPNYAIAHQWLAICLRDVGRFDEAMRAADKAQELDPISPGIVTTRALIFYFARQYDKAVKELALALELDIHPIAYFALGLACAQLGQYEDAIRNIQRIRRITGIDSPEDIAALGYVYAISGRTLEANELLGKLIEQAKMEYISPYYIATIYAGLGAVDKAFTFLEKSYQEQDSELCLLKIDPRLDSLRADLRFTCLLQRLGLIPEGVSNYS